jgi:hypothetical protein
MSNTLLPIARNVIPESVVRNVIDRWDDTRESLAQFWLANPALAKQGGLEVRKFLSPDNQVWLQLHDVSKHS